MTDAALNFDDLIPSEDQGSTPSAAAPNRRDAYISQRAPVMFDDLIPAAEATTPASRDSNEQRPPSRTDRFANESFGDLAKRRGQEVTGGFGEGRAGTLEGLGIMTQRSLERDSSRSAAIPMKEERDATISDIESRLKEPDLDQKTRTFLEGRLADLKIGSERLGSVAKGDASFARKDFFEKAADTRKWYEDTFGKAPEDDSLYSKIATGAGSAAQFLFDSTIAGGAAGKFGALVTGAAEGGSQNSASVYKDAIQHGATEEQALRAAGSAFVVGLAEVVPVGRAFGWLPQNLRPSFSSKLFQKIGEVAMNAGEEAAQEAFNQIANNAIAIGNGYDKDRSLTEGAGEAALIGSILGGGMTSAAVAVGGHGEPAPIRTEDTNPTVSTGETAPDVDTALKGGAAAPAAAPAETPKSAIPADQAAALNDNAPVPETAADITKRMMGAAAKPAAPVQETAPVTPAGNPAPVQQPVAEQPGPEATGDTATTVPETPETIASQNQSLLDPKSQRSAVFIPRESIGDGNIERPTGPNVRMLRLPDGRGLLFWNTKKTNGLTAKDAMAMYNDGHLGQFLGLGPFTKADVAQSAAAGNPEVAVTERTPEGIEVKSAGGTTATAPTQVAELEALKDQGNTVQVEDPAAVLNERQGALDELDAILSAQAERAAAPAQQATEQVANPTEQVASQPSAAAQAITDLDAAKGAAPAPSAQVGTAAKSASVREQAIRALEPQIVAMGQTVDAVLAMPEAQQRRVIEKAKLAMKPAAAPAQKPAKAQKAADTSKAKAAPVTAPGNTAPKEIAPTYETAPDGALVRVETDPESGKKTYIRTTKEIEEAYGRWNQQVKDVLTDKDQKAAAATDARAEQRTALREQVDQADRTGSFKDAVAETDALIKASGKNLTDDEKTQLRKNAKIAGDLMQEYAPDEFQKASTVDDKKRVLERLTKILEVAAERGFVWGRKGVTKHNARAVVWLYDVRTFQRKLSSSLGKVTYSDLNTFLTDEVAAKKGDVRNMKDRRLEVGAERSKSNGSGDTSQIAAIVNENPDAEPAADMTNDPRAEIEAKDKQASPEKSDEVFAETAKGADSADMGAKVTASKRGATLNVPTETGEIKNAKGETIKVERAVAANEGTSRKDLLAEYAAKYNTAPKTEAPKTEAPKTEKSGTITVHRAQRKGTTGDGVGEAAYGIGRYWSSALAVAERYKGMVVPVFITGPKSTVELNRRDALGDRSKMNAALVKAGLKTSDRESVVRVLAGEQGAALPDGASLQVGDSEIVEQELDTSKFVPQTGKARYNEFDLNSPEDVAKLKEQGIAGTSYEENGVTNYVEFPEVTSKVTEQSRKYGEILKDGSDIGADGRIGPFAFSFEETGSGARYLRVRTTDGSKLFQSAPGSERDANVTDIWSSVDPNQHEKRRGNKIGLNSVEENTPANLAPVFRDWLEGKIDNGEALSRIKDTEFPEVTSKVTEPSRLAARADAPMELTQSEWDAITDEFTPDPVDDARAVIDAGGTYYYDDIVVDQELREVIMGELGTDTPERHFAVGESTVGAELSMSKHPGVAEAVRNSDVLPENLRNLQADALVTVFDKIAEHVTGVKIYWLSAEDMARFDPYAHAYYVPDGDYIVAREDLIKDAARLTHVIPHEVAHAAFYHALREDSKLEAQVTALWRIARKWAVNRGTANNMYGLSNIDEFISEAFTNPEFQGFLSSVKLGVGDLVILKVKGLTVTERGKLRTALDWLRLKVAEVFGATGTTGFDAAMQIGEALLAASKGARASYYAKHPSRAARVPSRLAAQDPMAVKLKAHGLNPRQVKEVLDTIRKDFEGKATDEQLAAIAEEILRVTAPAKEAGKAINKAAKAAKASAKAGGKALNDKVVKAAGEDFVPGQKPGRPWLLWGMTNSQIARLAERWFGVENNPVRKLTEIIENRRVTKARYLKDMSRSVADIGAAQARHSKKQTEEFFSLVHDVTMAGVHPDVPLDHEKNAHLGKDALRGMWGKDQHSKLAARFEALPDDLKEVYAKTRDTLTDAQNRMAHGLMRNILNAAGHTDAAMIKRFHEDSATEQDYATVGEELAHHLKNATELKKIKGPYFNLARRGDWVVRGTYKITAPGNAKTIEPNVFEFATRKEAIAWAKTQELKADIKSIWIDKNTGKTYFEDEEGQVKVSPKDTDAKNVFRVTVQNQHVEFVNSRKEAERLTKDLRKEGMEVKDVEPKKWERDAQNAEMLSDQFRSLMSTLDKRGTTASLTPEQKGELKGMMNEVSLRFLGSTRIQSSRLPRRYVEGASIDLLHNTYDYVTETAGYLAKLDTEPKVEAAMKELEDRTAALSDQGKGYGTGAREISNEISKRVLDPHYGEMEGAVAGAVKRLTTASFIDNLASVGYSVVNALGVATMSMPHLSGDFNPATAAHQLIRAYHDVGAVRTVASGTADTVKALGNVTATGENYLSDVMARIKEPRERAMMQELSDIGLIDSEGGLDVERMVGEKDGLMQLVDVPLDYAQNVVRAMPQAIETINRTVTALAAYRMMFAKTKDHAKSVRYAADSVDMTQGNYSASNASPMFNSMIGRVVLQFKKYSQMVIYLLARNTRRAFKGQGVAEKARGIATIAYVVAGQQIMAGTLGLPLEPLKLAIMAAHGLGLDEDDWEDFQKKVEEFYAWLTGSEKAAEVLTYGVTRGLPGGWDFDLNSRIGMDNLLTFGEPRSAKEQDEKAWLFNLLTGAPGGTAYDMASGLRSVVQGDYAKGLPKLIPLKTVADAIKAKNDAQTVPEAVLKTMGLNPGRMAREGADNRREAGEAAEKKDKRNKLITGYIDSTSMADVTKMKSRIRQYNNALPKDSRDRISLKWVEELRRKEYKKKQ